MPTPCKLAVFQNPHFEFHLLIFWTHGAHPNAFFIRRRSFFFVQSKPGAYSSTSRVSACPQRRHSKVYFAERFDVAIMHIPHFGQGGRRGRRLALRDQLTVAF
jgi:hypothetical protein